MKYVKLTAICLCVMLLLSGCMEPAAEPFTEEDIDLIQFDGIKEGSEIAVIETTMGTIKMVLYPEQAPKTVDMFKRLAKEGFYDGKELFLGADYKMMITGIDDSERQTGKVPEDGQKLEQEISEDLYHFSGAVSTVGEEEGFLVKKILSDSRFFIVGNKDLPNADYEEMKELGWPKKLLDAYEEQGGIPQYDRAFTVFGQVYEGLELVNQIVELPVVSEEDLRPKDGTKVLKITFGTYETSN